MKMNRIKMKIKKVKMKIMKAKMKTRMARMRTTKAITKITKMNKIMKNSNMPTNIKTIKVNDHHSSFHTIEL